MNVLKRILRMLLLAVTFPFATALVSCEEIEGEGWERPDDMSPYIPDCSIMLAGSWSLSGSVADFDFKPHVFADFDYWQLKIKSVDYYIDETLIETATEEPYSFIYTAFDLSEGQHRLIAKVKIRDLVSHREIVILSIKAFEVDDNSGLELSNGLAFSANWSKSGNNAYFNVSNVGIWGSLADSGWALASVGFYFDSELIGTVVEEPFAFAYTARDLSVGKHRFVIKGKVVNALTAQEMELTREIEIEMP